MKLALLLVLVVLALCLFWPSVARSQEREPSLSISAFAQIQLAQLYHTEQVMRGLEVAFCAFGTRDADGNINVMFVLKVPFQQQEATEVHFDLYACAMHPLYLEIYGHSHPTWGNNYPSPIDWGNFARQGGPFTLLLWTDGRDILVTAYPRSAIPSEYLLGKTGR